MVAVPTMNKKARATMTRKQRMAAGGEAEVVGEDPRVEIQDPAGTIRLLPTTIPTGVQRKDQLPVLVAEAAAAAMK